MRKVIYTLLLSIGVGLMSSSCSKEKDNTFKIINGTGISFYDCTVYFSDTKDGEVINFVEVGDVLEQKSVKVEKLGTYFHIIAKNVLDKPILSYSIWVADETEIMKLHLKMY